MKLDSRTLRLIPSLALLVACVGASIPAIADEIDPNLTREGNLVMVMRTACILKGGLVSAGPRHFLCEGGFYDGFITSGPEGTSLASDPNLRQEGNIWIVEQHECFQFGGRVEADRRYFVCVDGTYDGFVTEGEE